MMAASTTQTKAMIPPHAKDDLIVALPMPTERNGRRSPRRIMSRSATAHTKFSDSLQIAAGNEKGGEKAQTAARTIKIPKKAINKHTPVNARPLVAGFPLPPPPHHPNNSPPIHT